MLGDGLFVSDGDTWRRRRRIVACNKGELLGRIPIPEDLCTNLAFGGPDRKTLHVTSGKSIYKIPLAVSGYVPYPPR